jgi:hypothetical protein
MFYRHVRQRNLLERSVAHVLSCKDGGSNEVDNKSHPYPGGCGVVPKITEEMVLIRQAVDHLVFIG